MNKNKLLEIKKCHYEQVERFIYESCKSIERTSLAQTLLVYAAYNLQEDGTFSEVCIPADLQEQYQEIITQKNEEIAKLNGEFDKDTLLAYVLFYKYDSRYQNCDATPESITELALKILDIKEEDQVLDLCSGNAHFITEAFLTTENVSYTGVEVNPENVKIAELKKAIVKSDWQFIQEDIFQLEMPKKYHKIFSNYPIGITRGTEKEIIRDAVTKLGFDLGRSLHRLEDWVVGLIALNQLSDDGKAVLIMSPAVVNGIKNRYIIEYLLENGFIETIIALPARLFNNTRIPTYCVVLSKGNSNVNMVDAFDLGVHSRLKCILEEDDIEEIVRLIGTESKISTIVSNEAIREQKYNLMPLKYLAVLPEFKDGQMIKELCPNLKRGTQLRASKIEDLQTDEVTPYRYLILSDLENGYLKDEKHYLEDIPESLASYCVTGKAIVMSKTAFPYFKSAYIEVEPGEKILVTGNMYILEFDEEKVNPAYVEAFLLSKLGVESIKSVSGGRSTLAIIPVNVLKEMIIPVPNKETQDMIAMKYQTKINEIKMLKKVYEEKKDELTTVWEDLGTLDR